MVTAVSGEVVRSSDTPTIVTATWVFVDHHGRCKMFADRDQNDGRVVDELGDAEHGG